MQINENHQRRRRSSTMIWMHNNLNRLRGSAENLNCYCYGEIMLQSHYHNLHFGGDDFFGFEFNFLYLFFISKKNTHYLL